MKNNRRMFFKGAATLGAGVLLSPPVIATEKIKEEVIASDGKTVVDFASGKLRGLWRSGIFVFKGIPYGGESLARHDVVVVTCNHRLNLFGYLNLTEVGGAKYAANPGLLDLVAVLQWVKDNITQFGGDPGNVTIFGQSGGGGKVLCLMAMPSAKGLFHRVINQSGPFLQFESRDTARAMTEEVMHQLGLARGDVDKLQDVPVDRLVGASAEMIKKLGAAAPVFRRQYGLAGWWATVDGPGLPRHPFDPDGPAISAHVPLITSSGFNEQNNSLDPEIRCSSTG